MSNHDLSGAQASEDLNDVETERSKADAGAGVAQRERRHWMAILARASRSRLEAAWNSLDAPPAYQWLRRPETGLAMLRGRAGGSGERFNLGEASVTRCALRTAEGQTGVAYVLGRDHRRAEYAALFDALMQDGTRRPRIEREIVAPLSVEQKSLRDEAGRKAAATRVDFYTLVRGENP